MTDITLEDDGRNGRHLGRFYMLKIFAYLTNEEF